MKLDDEERAMLAGEAGEAAAFAMGLISAYGEALGAPRLIPVAAAHVDGCLHHGAVSLDFVDRLVEGGGRVRVPTTLNVGSIDLIHPEIIRLSPPEQAPGRALMKAHLKLGCQPTFTCAPYQTRFRPHFGEQIAWGESNAIVFANSVIGARTNRYGDFIDLAAAITGRVPETGLHCEANRRGRILFRLPAGLADMEGGADDSLAVAVGALVGAACGDAVPVIEGLPLGTGEDQLKALGAVAASRGAVALFHAVGVTPEGPTVSEALGGRPPDAVFDVSRDDLVVALASLSTAPDGTPITAVSLGTPHFSAAEFARLMPLIAGFRPAEGVEFFINAGRDTVAALAGNGALDALEGAGITIVRDTCSYVTAVLRRQKGSTGVAMTNSGKWAHYAPGNLGVEVAFGTLADCVASAAAGRVVRRGPSW